MVRYVKNWNFIVLVNFNRSKRDSYEILWDTWLFLFIIIIRNLPFNITPISNINIKFFYTFLAFKVTNSHFAKAKNMKMRKILKHVLSVNGMKKVKRCRLCNVQPKSVWHGSALLVNS